MSKGPTTQGCYHVCTALDWEHVFLSGPVYEYFFSPPIYVSLATRNSPTAHLQIQSSGQFSKELYILPNFGLKSPMVSQTISSGDTK